jgi:hypothetical protein
MSPEQEHRIEILLAAGWKPVTVGWSPLAAGWEKDASDPRWSISGGRERVTGATFEDATRSAYRAQLARDADEIHRSAQSTA